MTERKSLITISRTAVLGVLLTTAFLFGSGVAAAENKESATISQLDLEIEGVPLTQLASAEKVFSDDFATSNFVAAEVKDGGYKKIVAATSPVSIDKSTTVTAQKKYERLFAKPLTKADYILIVETNGDAEMKLSGLDVFGLPIDGKEKSIDALQWDTGIGAGEGETYWVSILDASIFAGAQGLRTESNDADVQIIPLHVQSQEEILSEATKKAREQAAREKAQEVHKKTQNEQPVETSKSSTTVASSTVTAVADATKSTQTSAGNSVDVEITEVVTTGELSGASASDSETQETQVDEILPEDDDSEENDLPTADEPVAEAAAVEAPTELAFTGIKSTLILLVFAAGALFFGNTVRLAAVKENRGR